MGGSCKTFRLKAFSAPDLISRAAAGRIQGNQGGPGWVSERIRRFSAAPDAPVRSSGTGSGLRGRNEGGSDQQTQELVGGEDKQAEAGTASDLRVAPDPYAAPAELILQPRVRPLRGGALAVA